MRRNNHTDSAFMTPCFLCKRAFQFGPHIYNGRRIPRWDIMICHPSERGNWDGVVPRWTAPLD